MRFWEKVDPSGDCWVWTGRARNRGYGVVSVDGRGRLAHRVAWELERGPIPEGLNVLHRCDNPPCVRPDHLFLGTQADNMADMTEKKRRRCPKLNQSTAANLRQDLSSGMTHRAAAAKYGISRGMVSHVHAGRAW